MGLGFLVQKLKLYESLQAGAKQRISEKKAVGEQADITQRHLAKYSAEIKATIGEMERIVGRDFDAAVNEDLLVNQKATELNVEYNRKENHFTIEIRRIGRYPARQVLAKQLLEKAGEFVDEYLGGEVRVKLAPVQHYKK